jgi:hypothetical protein
MAIISQDDSNQQLLQARQEAWARMSDAGKPYRSLALWQRQQQDWVSAAAVSYVISLLQHYCNWT